MTARKKPDTEPEVHENPLEQIEAEVSNLKLHAQGADYTALDDAILKAKAKLTAQ